MHSTPLGLLVVCAYSVGGHPRLHNGEPFGLHSQDTGQVSWDAENSKERTAATKGFKTAQLSRSHVLHS